MDRVPGGDGWRAFDEHWIDNAALAQLISPDLYQEGNMLYFVAAVEKEIVKVNLGDKIGATSPRETKLAYGPDAFVAETAELAKQKALIRWMVSETELDSLEVYVLPFQRS